MAEKNTRSILESIKQKMVKFDQKEEEEKVIVPVTDEFDFNSDYFDNLGAQSKKAEAPAAAAEANPTQIVPPAPQQQTPSAVPPVMSEEQASPVPQQEAAPAAVPPVQKAAPQAQPEDSDDFFLGGQDESPNFGQTAAPAQTQQIQVEAESKFEAKEGMAGKSIADKKDELGFSNEPDIADKLNALQHKIDNPQTKGDDLDVPDSMQQEADSLSPIPETEELDDIDLEEYNAQDEEEGDLDELLEDIEYNETPPSPAQGDNFDELDLTDGVYNSPVTDQPMPEENDLDDLLSDDIDLDEEPAEKPVEDKPKKLKQNTQSPLQEEKSTTETVAPAVEEKISQVSQEEDEDLDALLDDDLNLDSDDLVTQDSLATSKPESDMNQGLDLLDDDDFDLHKDDYLPAKEEALQTSKPEEVSLSEEKPAEIKKEEFFTQTISTDESEEEEDDDLTDLLGDINLDDDDFSEASSVQPDKEKALEGAVEKDEITLDQDDDDDLLSDVTEESQIEEKPMKKEEASKIATMSSEKTKSHYPLIDEETMEKTSKSIKKLINANNIVHGMKSFSSGTAFSELAVQLMEPKLEKWVNENLSDLVEEIVRDEIQKIIPEAWGEEE